MSQRFSSSIETEDTTETLENAWQVEQINTSVGVLISSGEEDREEDRRAYEFSKRLFDCCFAVLIGVVLLVPLLLIALMIKASSTGPILYWSERVGRNRKNFRMAKFRTMLISTPEVASHALQGPGCYLTPVGKWLRKTSLDELPQLLNILKGEMSFVGPRPVILTEASLVEARAERGVYRVLPGITGWAQINGRDFVPIQGKAELDKEYVSNRSLLFDLGIILKTIKKVVLREDISH
jgi:O-antigen biosynthesis protein WbqP